MTRNRAAPQVIEQVPSFDFRIWHAKPGAMARAHSHPDIEINLLTSGRVRYFMGGRFYEIKAGETGIFWAGMPHQSLDKSKDVAGVWLTLPLLWLLRWRHAGALAARLLRGALVSYASPPAVEEMFAQWAREFQEGDTSLREIMAGEIEAHLSRVSIGLKEGGEKKRSAVPPAAQRMEKVTVFLGNRYRNEITVDEVALEAGLHPKYLLTLFRETCGMTLWEYVIRLRLAHAQRLLLTTDRTVLDVAMDSGFGSASAFYQAFRKYEGRVPREFRRG